MASSTLIIIALIDAPYQVYQHNQKMKMSLKEVKDERKDTEGSPRSNSGFVRSSERCRLPECSRRSQRLM